MEYLTIYLFLALLTTIIKTTTFTREYLKKGSVPKLSRFKAIIITMLVSFILTPLVWIDYIIDSIKKLKQKGAKI